MSMEHVLEVWGEFACFSRPEMKVERFSYPIITPSAARGILDAVFCKPSRDPTQAQFRWQVSRIEVLSPVSYIALRRNEVKEKVSDSNVKAWIKGTKEVEPIYADGSEDAAKGRTQRQTMALRDVRYRIHAHIVPWPGMENRLPGFNAQFERRARQGKCVYQPYFGCREFPAYFELAEPDGPSPDDWTQDLGFMLYDVFDLSTPGTCMSKAAISLFRAHVNDGVLEVPPYESDAVLKPERGNGRC